MRFDFQCSSAAKALGAQPSPDLIENSSVTSSGTFNADGILETNRQELTAVNLAKFAFSLTESSGIRVFEAKMEMFL